MSCTGQCVPVVSSWVRQFILTNNCNLAVWFRNGFCCVYPATTAAWFKQAIAAPRPGHFIHPYLYKKMAYRPIRPPCPPSGGVTVTCCPNSLPTTLHATFGGFSGPLACLNGLTVTLTWAAAASNWSGSYVACSSLSTALELGCFSTHWTIQASGDCAVAQAGPPTAASCSPLSVTFPVTGTSTCPSNSGNSGSGTITVTT